MPTENAALLRYFLQDDLYLLNEDKTAYATTPVAQPETETKKTGFNYLGGNNEKFLILVNYPAHEHLEEAHLKALESTLARKQLMRIDVAILNLAKHTEHNAAEVLGYFKPAKILILGMDAILQGLPPTVFNTAEAKSNYRQLHTYNFTEMIADRDKAKAFWEQVKNF